MWDGVFAEVDLYCGCIFTHEINHAEMKGGLADLNQAFGGKIQYIREQKIFEVATLKRCYSIKTDEYSIFKSTLDWFG